MRINIECSCLNEEEADVKPGGGTALLDEFEIIEGENGIEITCFSCGKVIFVKNN